MLELSRKQEIAKKALAAGEIALQASLLADAEREPLCDGSDLEQLFGPEAPLVEEFVDLLVTQDRFGGFELSLGNGDGIRGYKIGRRVSQKQYSDQRPTAEVYICQDGIARENTGRFTKSSRSGINKSIVEGLNRGAFEPGTLQIIGYSTPAVDTREPILPSYSFVPSSLPDLLLRYAQQAMPEYRPSSQ